MARSENAVKAGSGQREYKPHETVNRLVFFLFLFNIGIRLFVFLPA